MDGLLISGWWQYNGNNVNLMKMEKECILRVVKKKNNNNNNKNILKNRIVK